MSKMHKIDFTRKKRTNHIKDYTTKIKMIYYFKQTTTTTNNDTFVKKITNVLKCKKYEMLYVSFGGKYKEDNCFLLNSSQKMHLVASNGRHQIMPEFLKKKLYNDTNPDPIGLIVLVDSFSCNHCIQKNMNIIVEEINTNQLKVDVVLLDVAIHETPNAKFASLFQTLVDVAIHSTMKKENVYFCDYIKYIYPNVKECQLETQFPLFLNEILQEEKNQTYNDCLYVWFGQNIFLYNILYNYQQYNIYDKLNRVILHLLFEKEMMRGFVNKYNLYIMEKNQKNNKLKHALQMFVAHTLDITDDVGKMTL